MKEAIVVEKMLTEKKEKEVEFKKCKEKDHSMFTK